MNAPKKDCQRCLRRIIIRAATHVFDYDKHPGLTIIYLYLCRACWSEHTQVTRDRYKLIEEP